MLVYYTMENTAKQQTNFADCYVLMHTRTKAFILSFLDAFLPHREAYNTTYNVPELSEEPTIIFTSTETLIDYLENNKQETYGIYWHNKEATDLQGAMVLFYEEGHVVLGLCCQTLIPDTSIEKAYTERLMKFCNSSQSCILYEEPAPQSLEAFLSKVTPPHWICFRNSLN